jgi:AcrR family transcriptional regulator
MQDAEDKARGAILDGALDEFLAGGFARSSMTGIASAAGVSRPTLYKYFPEKEAVFKALSERINRDVYRDVIEAAARRGSLEERLVAIIDARIGWVYRLMHGSIHGAELISEKNRICGGKVIAANDRFAAFLASVLEPHLEGARGYDAEAASRLLIAAVNGMIETGETEAEIRGNVHQLIGIFVRGL